MAESTSTSDQKPANKGFSVSIESLEDYAQLFNGIFELTDRELTILVEFLRATLAIQESGRDLDPFSPEIKKRISKRVSPEKEDHYWLNGYVKALKDKNALVESNFSYDIHPLLTPGGESHILINLDWSLQ